MSKIDELFAEMCTDGIEYKYLWEITFWDKRFQSVDKIKQVKVISFKHVSAKQLKNLETKNGNIKLLATGQFDGFTSIDIAEEFINNGQVITIPTGGTANIKYYDGLFVDSGNNLAESSNTKNYNLKYTYYYLKSINDNIENLYRGSSVKHPQMSELLDLEIPVPPIEIQNEIVRILDKFTELVTELETELETRTKQYEYYRNKLLDFSTGSVGVPRIDKMLAEMCPDGVSKYLIDDIGNIYGGLKGKNKDHFSNGNKKYISYMNVYNNLETNLYMEDLVQITEGENQFSVSLGDIIFTGSSETPDECGISSVICESTNDDVYVNSFCFTLRPHENLLYPKFSKHLFRSTYMRNQIGKTANGVTRYNVSKKLFKNMEIYIPPIEIQIEIANILDDFSEYTTSITEGLPAEIELRKKQYEYYRNKLLTF